MKKTKDQVQKEAELAIDENNGRGMIVMATGTGKSKIIVNRANRKYTPAMRILIAVPTEKLRDVGWENEFKKWDSLNIYNMNVERTCYISMNKLHGQHYDLVVLDEVQNITVNNSRFFEQNTADEIICLTATLPESREKRDILYNLDLHVVYHVSLDEAVEWGLVSPYKITIVETKLNTSLKNVKAGNKLRPFMQTEYDAYIYLTKKIISLQEEDDANSKYLQMLIFKRMRLIYDLESKTEIGEFILANVIPKNERTLIFCGSIKQADRLNPYSFHSKSKNSESFDGFLNEGINRLSCVNSLNEGHNIPNLDNALVIQLNSKELNLVQRIGRIVRYRDGHIARVYIIMCKNTVDENWTLKSLSNFDSDNIERVNFETFKMKYVV